MTRMMMMTRMIRMRLHVSWIIMKVHSLGICRLCDNAYYKEVLVGR